MRWFEYHEATKHTADSLRRSQHFLDWANMPDPFRHYEGAPLVDLPAESGAPATAALDVLRGVVGSTSACEGAGFLSELLFYSAATSASKTVRSTGYRYALRVNPSSGNLHPTEFHFVTRGLQNWPDGLYHYRPSAHMAEQRAAGNFDLGIEGASAPIVMLLTSIAWREAWKYGERAYRYCLHDMGHAWQAVALAATAMGCESFAEGRFPDDELAQKCRLHKDEWPMLVIRLQGGSIPVREPDEQPLVWSGGQANELSDKTIAYPYIDDVHQSTKADEVGSFTAECNAAPRGPATIKLPEPARSARTFAEVVRTRRSALDFEGGSRSMSLGQLSAILSAAASPLKADFASTCFVQLYLYVHRVEGMEPGVYRHWPEQRGLERVKRGDQRAVAAGLSLGQDLAGNACVAFSMIADLEQSTRAFGDRGYRYAHFEAGAIGQRLYLAAEAVGLRGTGIGAFFDDEVHRYLDLTPVQGQVIYHFAIGHAVPDLRVGA